MPCEVLFPLHSGNNFTGQKRPSRLNVGTGHLAKAVFYYMKKGGNNNRCKAILSYIEN